MSAPKLSACHTCRRQRLRCDAVRPSCRKCATRGVECMGYGANPILWVQPQVQSEALIDGSTEKGGQGIKTGKRRGRPKLVLMGGREGRAGELRATSLQLQRMKGPTRPVGDFQGQGVGPGVPAGLESVGYQEQMLALESMCYYNDKICPDLVLLDSPSNLHRLPLKHWESFPEIVLDIIISASKIHQVIRSTAGQGLLVPATSKEGNSNEVLNLKRHHLEGLNHPSLPVIYKHQQRMFKAMNEKLSDDEVRYGDGVLRLITSLMRAEIQQSAFGAWKAHLEAARTIIAQRGGFTALAAEEVANRDFILSRFMFVDVMNSVMTPRSQLDARTKLQLEYIPLITALHKDGSTSGFPCPNELLVCLIRVSHARYLRSTSHDDGDGVDSIAIELLRQISRFSPSCWAGRQDLMVPSTKACPGLAPNDSGASDDDAPSPDEAIQFLERTPELIAGGTTSQQDSWRDLGGAFQAAVMLYCIQTLFPRPAARSRSSKLFTIVEADDPSDSLLASIDNLRIRTLQKLLDSLHRMWSCELKEASWCGKFSVWPLFIAGMELECSAETAHEIFHGSGTAAETVINAEKAFISKSLRWLCYHLGDFSPLDAALLLEMTWERSGEALKGEEAGNSWVEKLALFGVGSVFFF